VSSQVVIPSSKIQYRRAARPTPVRISVDDSKLDPSSFDITPGYFLVADRAAAILTYTYKRASPHDRRFTGGMRLSIHRGPLTKFLTCDNMFTK